MENPAKVSVIGWMLEADLIPQTPGKNFYITLVSGTEVALLWGIRGRRPHRYQYNKHHTAAVADMYVIARTQELAAKGFRMAELPRTLTFSEAPLLYTQDQIQEVASKLALHVFPPDALLSSGRANSPLPDVSTSRSILIPGLPDPLGGASFTLPPPLRYEARPSLDKSCVYTDFYQQ